jgi:hypothetical protein
MDPNDAELLACGTEHAIVADERSGVSPGGLCQIERSVAPTSAIDLARKNAPRLVTLLAFFRTLSLSGSHTGGLWLTKRREQPIKLRVVAMVAVTSIYGSSPEFIGTQASRHCLSVFLPPEQRNKGINRCAAACPYPAR